METLYLLIVIFLFALAVVDLAIGVSNDAVNFLNSAVGSRAGSFRTVLIVAAVGIFLGSAFSNGMMDLTRHGIFRPEHFTFAQLMDIFMAVMVADIILLDIFNSLGLPTSTTVSRIFELLGASFTLALLKMTAEPEGLALTEYINTDKALTVILSIFLSVTIAFVFGMAVQWLTRLVFSFDYRPALRWLAGLFGGVACAAIIYFMLIKGVRDMSFMTADVRDYVDRHTPLIMGVAFAACAVACQVLHWLRVNVLRLIVLLGTLSLAMAFAGNDLVNFIGVPIAGFEIFGYFREALAGGVERPDLMSMEALNGPADTPLYFLIASGVVMVVSLSRSEKAKNVVRTSVSLSSQDGGDEMFGSSRAARHIVRFTRGLTDWVDEHTPERVRRFIDRRFDTADAILPDGAAFDLLRAAINLVLAGLLVALGTSLKLPLSTTYVTFMVAMGTSLADRAWGRESAVFRITGVISVIGGWLVTAGASFILAAVIVVAMHFGGLYASAAIIVASIGLLVHNNLAYDRRAHAPKSEKEQVYDRILACADRQQTWQLLKQYISLNEQEYLRFFTGTFHEVATAFADEDVRSLRRANNALPKQKNAIKAIHRKQTVGLRRTEPRLAIEHNTWLHLIYNSNQQMNYCLMRMLEPCLEHVDNNFASLNAELREQLLTLRDEVEGEFEQARQAIEADDYQSTERIRKELDRLKSRLSGARKSLVEHIHEDMDAYSVIYVYLNMLQETQELIGSLRHNLRALRKIERDV